MKDVNKRCECSFVFLNLAAVLKNSSPGKFAYIWQIERGQINTIEFEIIVINFFSNVFTVVVIVVDLVPQYLTRHQLSTDPQSQLFKAENDLFGLFGL